MRSSPLSPDHRFDLRQANCSVSAAGVLRGVHFAQLPPSQDTYVGCPRGKALDVSVGIRGGVTHFRSRGLGVPRRPRAPLDIDLRRVSITLSLRWRMIRR
jgi:hypothetical protein